MRPVFGHKGVLRLKFSIRGKTAHSSQPQLGKNAVLAGAKLALAMEKENERLQKPTFESELGSSLLTVTTLKGGLGENIVPDLCEMTIDRRIVNRESAADVREYLHSLASQTISLPFTIDVIHEIDAFHQPLDSPFVGQLAAWTGQTPTTARHFAPMPGPIRALSASAWCSAQAPSNRLMGKPNGSRSPSSIALHGFIPGGGESRNECFRTSAGGCRRRRQFRPAPCTHTRGSGGSRIGRSRRYRSSGHHGAVVRSAQS